MESGRYGEEGDGKNEILLKENTLDITKAVNASIFAPYHGIYDNMELDNNSISNELRKDESLIMKEYQVDDSVQVNLVKNKNNIQNGNETLVNIQSKSFKDQLVNNQNTELNFSEIGYDLNKQRYKFEKKFYELSDHEPYIVYAESINKNIARLHHMAVGKIIYGKIPNVKHGIKHISVIGKNKIKIECANINIANNLLKEDTLRLYNLKTYIPRYLTVRAGVIYDVDPELEEEEILNVIESDIEVMEVKCMKSKYKEQIRNNKGQAVKIIFKGRNLPDKVSIHCVKCDVTPFIQKVTQCFNCWRFGHVSNQCRSKVRCVKCANDHKEDVCEVIDEFICAGCQLKHKANDKDCEIYKKNKNIKELMAFQNISYKEARSIVYNDRYARTVKKNPFVYNVEKDFPKMQNRQFRNTPIKKQSINEKRFDILSDLEDNEDNHVENNFVFQYKKPKRVLKNVKNIIRKSTVESLQEKRSNNSVIDVPHAFGYDNEDSRNKFKRMKFTKELEGNNIDDNFNEFIDKMNKIKNQIKNKSKLPMKIMEDAEDAILIVKDIVKNMFLEDNRLINNKDPFSVDRYNPKYYQ